MCKNNFITKTKKYLPFFSFCVIMSRVDAFKKLGYQIY